MAALGYGSKRAFRIPVFLISIPDLTNQYNHLENALSCVSPYSRVTLDKNFIFRSYGGQDSQGGVIVVSGRNLGYAFKSDFAKFFAFSAHVNYSIPELQWIRHNNHMPG